MGRNPENDYRYTSGLSKNERIDDFGHVEVDEKETFDQAFERVMSPKAQSKKSRAIDDGVCYETTAAKETDNIPDVQENINKLLKVVTQTQEAFTDLKRRLDPALTPEMKSCEEKDGAVKHSDISPLGSELRSITNMVRNLQFDIAEVSDRIQL